MKLLTIKAEVESARRLGFDTANRAADLFTDDFRNKVVIRWGNSNRLCDFFNFWNDYEL